MLVRRLHQGGRVTTLLHTYRLVSALLYRLQARSVIAESAWDMATSADLTKSTLFGKSSILKLNVARTRAIAIMSEGIHVQSERLRAIVAIDEAVRTAVEIDLRDIVVSELSLELATG